MKNCGNVSNIVECENCIDIPQSDFIIKGIVYQAISKRKSSPIKPTACLTDW